MESVRCYLCDHEFVKGEEPWLMFEHRLREDGKVECSLAELIGGILKKHLEESSAHSTLLCDSCNADVLEYENLEKQFYLIRERILTSYKENLTIRNLNNLLQITAFTDSSSPHQLNENNKLLVTNSDDIVDNLSNSEYAAIIDTDLVEEVQDEELEPELHDDVNVSENENISHHGENEFMDDVKTKIIDNYDFAAFNEHVAQNSLPSGVLNLSDSLVNLDVSDRSLEVRDISDQHDIIIYDVKTGKIHQDDLIVQDDCGDLTSYEATVDDDLNFIISSDILTSDGNCEESQQSPVSEVKESCSRTQKETGHLQTPKISPNPVCKKDGEKFFCLLCENSDQFECPSLVEHFQIFHNSKFYMCEKCHEGFHTSQELKIHTEICHMIQCEFCERTFTNMRMYRLHKRTHYVNSKPFECPVCQKFYVSKAILEDHMNTHTGVRPFQCTQCSKDFASKYTLQIHLKIHQERPRPYQCDQCQKRFLNQQNLNQHKKLHVSVRAFQCDKCSKTFTTQHSLQVHKVVHTGQRPFICRICGKAFARRPEIQDHERTHTGEKPFKCDFCPMAFAQRTNLATHRKSTHFNEKLHKCDICLRSFKRKRLMDYHIQAIHTGERPFKCGICGSGFVYPEHYKKHMLIHSGKKPYACEVCGKQFNSRDNRNAHRFVHSDKKPYECMDCGAGFMRKPLLLSHMKQTKHINDTIIINQPQFTQHLTEKTEVPSSAQSATLHGEDSEIDVDNDLKSQDVSDEAFEKIIFNDQLIKGDLDHVKYLEFDDLERDGHQTLNWVHLGAVDKV